MKILDRYIGKQVLSSSLLVLMVLVGLFTFIDLVDDLGTVGRGTYSLGQALEYQLLRLPRRSFDLFPLAAMVGSVVGLGGLAASGELTVIRTSGVSLRRLLLAVLKAAALIMLLVLAIGELLAPVSERIAQQQRSLAITGQMALRTANGFWIRDGRSFIHVRKLLSGDEVADLYIYEFDKDNRLRVVTKADHARFQDDKWLLEDILQSRIGDDRVAGNKIASAAWNSLFVPELVEVVSVKPESLSALGLYRYLDYLRDNGLSTERYEVAFWGKLVYPLATGVMIFLGVAMVLGQLGAATMGTRMLVGALVGIGFHTAHQTSVQMGVVYGLSPFFSTLTPTLLFLGVGLWMLRSTR